MYVLTFELCTFKPIWSPSFCIRIYFLPLVCIKTWWSCTKLGLQYSLTYTVGWGWRAIPPIKALRHSTRAKVRLNRCPEKAWVDLLINVFSAGRISHNDDIRQYNMNNNNNDCDHSEEKYSFKKEFSSIDFNYNTSLESSRNIDDLSKSRPPSVADDEHSSCDIEEEEKAQDLSMSNYEAVNHVIT